MKPSDTPARPKNRMRRTAVIIAIVATALATADYSPPRVSWRGWSVGYEVREFPGHQYFIGNMLDGDPKTAWMVGGVQEYSGEESKYLPDFDAFPDPTIFIDLPRAMKIDGIRIMPGYNKSREIFERNNRITGIAVGGFPVDEPADSTRKPWEPVPLATAVLKDEMGWQEVRFAAKSVTRIEFKLTEWVAGTDNDFCISELQLLSNGEPIDWDLTPVLLSTYGSS